MSMEIGSQTALIPSFCSSFKINGILAAAYLNLALNTALLAKKIFASFPENIAIWSRAVQKLSGLFFFSGLKKEWVKSCKDTYAFYERRNFLGVIVAGNKVLYQTIDNCLVAGGLLVAIAAVFKKKHWSKRFYKFMFPFTITSQVLSCIDYLSNIAIHKNINSDSRDQDLWMRVQMTAWDQDNLQNRSMDEARRQLERNSICSMIELTKTALFYISQGLGKLNPDSKISVGITWCVSVISVASLHFRKN